MTMLTSNHIPFCNQDETYKEELYVRCTCFIKEKMYAITTLSLQLSVWAAVSNFARYMLQDLSIKER